MPKKRQTNAALPIPQGMMQELNDAAEFYQLPVEVLGRAVIRAFLDMVDQECSTLDLPLAFQQVPTA